MPEVIGREAVSVRGTLTRGTAVLQRAGCDTPQLDASILLAMVLGCDRAGLALRSLDPVAADALDRFGELLARRVGREPVAYITGRKAFRRLSLTVDRRVLIPRPETELLVEVGLGLDQGVRVADVGTGSGAVALALKDERRDLQVIGVDLSPDAVVVARANAALVGLDVTFVEGDVLAGVACEAVLANLPYVCDGTELAPEIALYEPAGALFGGPDGLDLVRRLVGQLAGVEVVALELGLGQAEVVCELLHGAGFGSVSRLRDLAGHERVVVGRR